MTTHLRPCIPIGARGGRRIFATVVAGCRPFLLLVVRALTLLPFARWLWIGAGSLPYTCLQYITFLCKEGMTNQKKKREEKGREKQEVENIDVNSARKSS